MTTRSEEMKKLTKKDIHSLFWRSFLLPSCYSLDRMQAPGFAYSMLPTIKRLYSDDKEKFIDACQRHSEVYNNTFAMSPFVLGITSAMEEEAANNEDFEVSSINNIKVALMGPLSGIGDTFFWGTFRIIGAGVGISFAEKGSILGPILFLLIYNIPHFLVRFYGLKYGYRLGSKSIDTLVSGGLMTKATKAATVMGLTVIGGMIASLVKVNIAYVAKIGDVSLELQSIFDQISPKMLPLLLTFIIYKFIKKNVSPVKIMGLLVLAGIVFKFLGIM